MSNQSAQPRPPSRQEIRKIAAAHHFTLREEEEQYLARFIADSLADYAIVDELPDVRPERSFTDRDPGFQPTPDTDPYNAFVTKCEVDGAETGPLAGYEIGLKDCISVGGVPMTCGLRAMEGYVPQTDATVVRWLLEAGGTITGKLNLSSYSYSGATGEWTATGPVLNPNDPERVAGGSSSGSAAAVVAGDVDVALGGDQGGSIRIPAAWCGCVGLKPTFGLVPYTGIQSLHPSIDHVGPLALSVTDCATVLQTIVGDDPLDPRQGRVEVGDYEAACTRPLSDFSIGIVEEGFDLPAADTRVLETVRNVLEACESDGAAVDLVSVPWHSHGSSIWTVIAHEAVTAVMRNHGPDFHAKGFYDKQFAAELGKIRQASADEFPPSLKLTLVLGEYMARTYPGQYRPKAENLRLELTQRYDELLANVDVLAMPTLGTVAPEAKPEITAAESIERGFGAISNTAPFNLTGHPAMTVPCGTVDDLPVGIMLVTERFQDKVLFGIGSAIEEIVAQDS